MDNRTFPVSIDGNTYLPEQQTGTNRRWKEHLAYGHRKDVTFCLCDRNHPVPLVIRHYSARSGTAHYGLARWRGTNWDHHPDCRFFSEAFEDGRGAEVSPAFQELENDQIRVYLSRSLGIATESSTVKPQVARSADESVGRRTRSKASDIALLNRVWQAANLNIYRQHETTWFNGSLRFLHAASKFVVRRTGETLAEFLLLGASANSRNAQAHNANVLERAKQRPTRLYLLARLRAPTQAQADKHRFLLPLRDYEGLPKVLIEKDLLDRFFATRQFAHSALTIQAANVIALLSIEPNGNDWWRCVDVTGFVASAGLIPVESSYELAMERYLVGQSRIFVKPIHGEESDAGSGRRPDFLLLDTKPRTAVEVWGMATPEYLLSKQNRLAWYREKRIPLLSWNAVDGEALPTLPAPTV